MKKFLAIISLVGLMFTFACEDPNEDIYKDLSKLKKEQGGNDPDYDAKSGL
ncbi:hypothetical protein [Chondrinema litorale]|uniref:hypothetical protein n=1 Tax=Chondrinema litorale TaxID=2994555 RepID=UPI002542B1D4|nr:hypothetical protein [Chondrinema litorale]UZR94286.1 hypothetical protein OQ292_00455 [Chondrinema litorale]